MGVAGRQPFFLQNFFTDMPLKRIVIKEGIVLLQTLTASYDV